MSGEREEVLNQSWEYLCAVKYGTRRIWNIDENGAQANKNGGAECCPWEVLWKHAKNLWWDSSYVRILLH